MSAILNTRILAALGMIVFVGAIVIGATGAFFSDTETSTGNTFTAGELDLTIDNTSYGFDWNNPAVTNPTGVWGPNPNNSWALSNLTNQLFFSFDDLKPGDYGEDTISMHVQNSAWACMAFDLGNTPDNGINGPEADALDVTDGALGGELQNYLSFLFWRDDGDNVLEVGETVIPELSGLPGSAFTGNWLAIADQGDTPLAAGATSYIGKGWCFGTMVAAPIAQDGVNTNPPSAPARVGFTCDGAGNHNVAQTDGIVVDVHFYSEQSRNNPNFLCSQLPPPAGGQAGPTVGANISAFVDPAPGICEATVNTGVAVGGTNFHTIQTAINDAGTVDGETICVADGTYAEDVNINKSIELIGSGATSTSVINGVLGGQTGAVSIAANNVTVSGFAINGVAGSVAAMRFTGAHSGAIISYNKITSGSGGGAVDSTGSQTNHTFSNNEFVGVAGSQLVYINGLASLNVASTNVDFTSNTFSGAAGIALGQEAGGSSITLNKFSTVTGSYDVEDWEGGNNYNQNNFNDAGLNLQHSENANTGENGITNAQNNWWGDNNPADGDVAANVDVDTTGFTAVAFPQN